MFTIICGDDQAASRAYYLSLILKFKSEGNSIRVVISDEIRQIPNGLDKEQMLFSNNPVFFIENLEKNIGDLRKKSNSTTLLIESLKVIASSKDIKFFDWEGNKSGWELKLKKIATVKEFKATSTIFSLVESCYPSNRDVFLTTLNNLVINQDEQFIFIMLVRHIRSLILAQSNSLPTNTPPWQKYKLLKLCKLWTEDRLIKFYEGLHRIDISLKTQSSPGSLRSSLDILACYFL